MPRSRAACCSRQSAPRRPSSIEPTARHPAVGSGRSTRSPGEPDEHLDAGRWPHDDGAQGHLLSTVRTRQTVDAEHSAQELLPGRPPGVVCLHPHSDGDTADRRASFGASKERHGPLEGESSCGGVCALRGGRLGADQEANGLDDDVNVETLCRGEGFRETAGVPPNHSTRPTPAALPKGSTPLGLTAARETRSHRRRAPKSR
ncbi:MAG: hypothetical protein ACI9MC_003233 [Kiritimatiellia bacterium]